jgi:SAM-dependent methyltransferase
MISVADDIRAAVAEYYDLNPQFPADIAFYKRLIASPDTSILELGCGTGRVLVPLASECGFIQGLDSSAAMLAICRAKLRQANLPASRASVARGDITNFELERTFDLVIAPFRVLQNLETDEQLDGLFAGIRRHLSDGGSCVLNAFRPRSHRDELLRSWVTGRETLAWEVAVEGGRVTCHDMRPRLRRDPLVLYPELIWRRYRGEELADEVKLQIAMRCYYPGDLEALVTSHGFQILDRWGGYAGEAYGEGPELVIRFTHARR